MAGILNLPEEILTLIFKFYLETETQAAFLDNIGNVKLWSTFCKRSVFWKKVDGSLSLSKLNELSKCQILRKTEEIKLSKPDHRYNMEKIFFNMPCLKSINFSNINYLEKTIFSYIAKSCPDVCELKFGDNTNNFVYSVSWKLLGNFLVSQGQNLTVIDFSYTDIIDCQNFIRRMVRFCPNLLQLFLRELQSSCKFPIAAVQQGCSKLKVLRLGSPVFFSENKEETQFSNLEIFAHPVAGYDYAYSNLDILGILGGSFNLKVLDLRGCSVRSLAAILKLPATHLECLHLTGSNRSFQFVFPPRYIDDLHLILLKWQSSLRIVEISKFKSEEQSLSDILIDVVSMGKMKKLEQLHLNDTSISVKAVIQIIKNCESLKLLNLTSCRNMGTGNMRVHDGKQALEKLLERLEKRSD